MYLVSVTHIEAEGWKILFSSDFQGGIWDGLGEIAYHLLKVKKKNSSLGGQVVLR